MKTVYFIRHGESEGNLGLVYQGPDTPLTQNGIVQTNKIAERLKGMSFDVFIASPFKRTRHTAEIIKNAINKPINFLDLIVERRRPSCVIGKKVNHPETLVINDLIKENYHNNGWRHSDEECFNDLKERALQAIEHIDKLEEEKILIVSHGLFIKMIAACILMGEDVTSHDFIKIYTSLKMNNTGVTIMKKLDSSKYDKLWQIVTWNDTSHLKK